MGMNSATLATAMRVALLAGIAPWESPADDHRLTGLSRTEYWAAVTTAIASTTVAHIQSEARCSGADSRGDSHDNVQIT